MSQVIQSYPRSISEARNTFTPEPIQALEALLAESFLPIKARQALLAAMLLLPL